MKGKKIATVLASGKASNIEAFPAAFSDPILGVVIQDNFSSEEDREEFMQAITSHGITFLRCAASPFPKPSTDDLSLLEKLARILSGLWTTSDKQRCCNDA